MKQRTFWRYWIQNKLNQHYDNQNKGRTLHLWHYFMQNPKAPQAKKIHIHNSFFSQVCFQFFLQICGYKSGFAVENPQNSVWLDWLSARPKISNAPLWRVCQPWIHERECLSTIPFARNTGTIEASSCPGIFFRAPRVCYVASSPSSPLSHLHVCHRWELVHQHHNDPFYWVDWKLVTFVF